MALIEVNWRPNPHQLRTFGIVAGAVAVGLGSWIYFRLSLFSCELLERQAWTMACALWGAGALCFLMAATAPGALRPLYLVLTVVTLPIGFVVSHVLLATLYFGVITPLGLAMRTFGRDPMCRRFEPKMKTYWMRRQEKKDVRSYFRKF